MATRKVPRRPRAGQPRGARPTPPPSARYVAILARSANDIELAAAELNEAAFQLQAARGAIEPNPVALRQAARDVHDRLSYVLALALSASAAAERLAVIGTLLEGAS